jgi:hypothetical protein
METSTVENDTQRPPSPREDVPVDATSEMLTSGEACIEPSDAAAAGVDKQENENVNVNVNENEPKGKGKSRGNAKGKRKKSSADAVNKAPKKARRVKGYIFPDPATVQVPTGVDLFVNLSKEPVQSLSPTPSDSKIAYARFVLYDNFDKKACVHVQLVDQSTRYLLVPISDIKPLMTSYKQRLASMQMECVDPDSGDYLSLQQVQDMFQRYAEATFNSNQGKKRRRHVGSWASCVDTAVQLSRLLEQFALQGGCLKWSLSNPEPEPESLPSLGAAGQTCRRPYGNPKKPHDLRDLLIQRDMAASLIAAMLENSPWASMYARDLIPSLTSIEKMLKIEERAKGRVRMSVKQNEYQRAYEDLVKEIEKKKSSRNKNLREDESSSGGSTKASPTWLAGLTPFAPLSQDCQKSAEALEGSSPPIEASETPEPAAALQDPPASSSSSSSSSSSCSAEFSHDFADDLDLPLDVVT